MRFIGSKVLLLEKIDAVIQENVVHAETFCDIFSGTAAVARHFKNKYKIISNDILYFSYVLQMATLFNNQKPKFDGIFTKYGKSPFSYFASFKPNVSFSNAPLFIYENYSPNLFSNRQYFTNENALRIDFVRQTLENWYEKNLLTKGEYFFLLACLIESVPFVSNIAGTYGAFLKHWDKRAYKTLELVELEIKNNNRINECFNIDSNQLIKKIKGDILYIDPPYNRRQYAPNYHILETIARYDSPILKGKTGLRPYRDIYSKYCLKKSVLSEFADLIKNAQFNNIIVSYSNEGIMSPSSISDILLTYGIPNTFKLYEFPYRRYKHIAGSVKHNLKELIFFVKKGS
jgi:adenine-specific DNA-methyltransferase